MSLNRKLLTQIIDGFNFKVRLLVKRPGNKKRRQIETIRRERVMASQLR
jgi:hypothetical protein